MVEFLADPEVGITRLVPDVQDFIETRQRHKVATMEEPIFLLAPQTFTDFVAYLTSIGISYEGTVNTELGEGVTFSAAAPGHPGPVYRVFPDAGVDEGQLEVLNDRTRD